MAARKTSRHSAYKLVVFDVQEDQLGPEMCLFGRFDDLQNHMNERNAFVKVNYIVP